MRIIISPAKKMQVDTDSLPIQALPDFLPETERLLTDNEGFRLLIPQTEQQLGKKLRTADLQILAGLYDQIGMPADVIYLLVCHCVERARRQWGEGRHHHRRGQ